jgi:hypothetical protein
MKKLMVQILAGALFLTLSTAAYASPTNDNKADNNPQVVAFYTDHDNTLPTDPITYHAIGTDLVMMRGDTGEIQQWYTFADNPNHGLHSVWNISKDGTCSPGWVLISQAYPLWGDYLTPGADYCVHNNAF